MQDRGRLLDLGQVDDRDVVILTGIGVDRDGSVDKDPFAVQRVLVVGDVWASGFRPGSAEPDFSFAAFFRRKDAGGVLVVKEKERSA